MELTVPLEMTTDVTVMRKIRYSKLLQAAVVETTLFHSHLIWCKRNWREHPWH